jgi:2-dehydropantoate 2-reductase
MKILVLGAGGIGGYFGGRLAQGGADVTFLVRPKRAARIAANGLVIESPNGNAQLAVKTVTAEAVGPGYDLVLFTCKAYDLDSAMDAIAPAMAGGAVVVPMLNGIAHLAKLDARFGKAKVMGGTCQINVTLAPDGTVKHMEPLNRLTFGERDGTESPRAKAFAAELERTSIDATLSATIEQDMWEKLMFLSVLASVTCLFRGNIAEVLAAPGGRAALERAIAANIEIVSKCAAPPRGTIVEWARGRLLTPGPAASSMLRDVERGNPVEADHIVGFMLERAREHGVDDVILALAFAHLKTYEARRAAGRLPSA